MLIRDGRRTQTDHGPRRTFQPSLMKMVAWEGTGSGGWQTMTVSQTRPVKKRPPKAEYNRQARANALEHYRELERIRAARYRARRKQ
jgi:hypothetical protein